MSHFEFSDKPQTLRVFNYAADTQEYIGAGDVYIAPDTGLPGCCTLIEPPETTPGYAQIWDGQQWNATEDHRGKTLFSTTFGYEINITKPGPLPADVTPLAPNSNFDRWNGDSWQPDIDAVRSAKIEEIKDFRDRITTDYIIIDGHHFHSDVSSRIRQLTLTKMGQARQIPSGLMWQTKNHGLVELTNEIAARFESLTIAHDIQLFAIALQHIAAVEVMETVEAIMGYDYSQGWQP